MTTINLRLSPALEDRARRHSDHLGISINALMSVAVDAYFRSLDGSPARPAESALHEPATMLTPMVQTSLRQRPMSAPGPNATKKERQAWTSFQRNQRKLDLDAR
jgi:hypothetical protein